jgi:predicted ABC-type ATPase
MTCEASAMGSLLIVTGPPGAGKSTVAAEIVERHEPSALVEGDTFFGFLRRGAIDPWLPESEAQNDAVTAAAGRATGEFVRGGFATVFAGIVGPWYLDHFCNQAGLERVDYCVLLPTEDRCLERVRQRADHGFRDGPATSKMHVEFAAATVGSRHVLVNPPDAVSEVIGLIEARRNDSSLEYRPGMG